MGIVGIRARSQSAEDWDQQYASGQWGFLDDLAESAHYGVIAGWAHRLKPKSILDVGCGHGVLTDHLKTLSYRDYLGIDFSPQAVTEAENRHADERTAFQLADARTFTPDHRLFDLIIFNESLYLLGEPRDVFAHYSHFLAPGGRYIVSMFLGPSQRLVWHALRKILSVEDSVTVSNRSGFTWTIEILVPKD